MEDIFFDKSTFWRWFFYACWQGTVLMFLSFYTLDGNSDGIMQMGELEIDGQFVFAALVIIVNVKVLISSYQYTFWLLFWVLGSIFSFFPVFWAVCYFGNYTFSGVFNHMFASGQVYMLLIFFCSCFVLIDQGLQMANGEIRNYMLERNVIKRKLAKKQAKRDTTIIRKQISTYQNRGYAYSGEAGHDVLVTDSLSNRLQDALRRQLFAKGMFTQNLDTGKVEPGARSLQPQSNLLLGNNLARQATQDLGDMAAAQVDPYDSAKAPLLEGEDIEP